MDLDEITLFLGWCTAINIGILTFSALVLFLFKDFVINTHSRLAGVSASQLPSLYFAYMGNYKIGILIFNLVPYIALKLMS